MYKIMIVEDDPGIREGVSAFEGTFCLLFCSGHGGGKCGIIQVSVSRLKVAGVFAILLQFREKG